MSESEELEALCEHYTEGISDALRGVDAEVDVGSTVIEQCIVDDTAQLTPVITLKVVLYALGSRSNPVPAWVSIYPSGDYELDLTNVEQVHLLRYGDLQPQEAVALLDFKKAIQAGLRKTQASWQEMHRPATAATQAATVANKRPPKATVATRREKVKQFSALPVEEIAEKCNVSVATINRDLKALGLVQPRKAK